MQHMDMMIMPSQLAGKVQLPPSKSHMHRLLIASAMSDRPTHMCEGRLCEDTRATIGALIAMGVRCALIDGLTIMPITRHNHSPTIFCGESGTTARLIMPMASHLYGKYTLCGAGTLNNRPFAPLCRTLMDNGCAFSADTLPISASGRLKSGVFRLRGDVSSQFTSGLLFALPLLNNDSEIVIERATGSQPYVEMTLDVMSLFSINIEKTVRGYRVYGNQHYTSPGCVAPERDWSGAAAFLCMNALGADIAIDGLSSDDMQGDKCIVSILSDMAHGEDLYTVNVAQTPDLAPLIAATACGFSRTVVITGAAALHIKESDRIASTIALIRALGGDATATHDGMIVRGRGRLNGGVVNSARDHRIVMAAMVAAMVCDSSVIIRGAEAVDKSYPEFFSDFVALGGVMHVL